MNRYVLASLTLSALAALSEQTSIAAQLKGEPPPKATAKEDKAWLGVGIRRPNKKEVEAFKLDRVIGAIVLGMLPNSPADKGGLKKDDLILRINDDSVKDQRHFVNMVSKHRAGA